MYSMYNTRGNMVQQQFYQYFEDANKWQSTNDTLNGVLEEIFMQGLEAYRKTDLKPQNIREDTIVDTDTKRHKSLNTYTVVTEKNGVPISTLEFSIPRTTSLSNEHLKKVTNYDSMQQPAKGALQQHMIMVKDVQEFLKNKYDPKKTGRKKYRLGVPIDTNNVPLHDIFSSAMKTLHMGSPAMVPYTNAMANNISGKKFQDNSVRQIEYNNRAVQMRITVSRLMPSYTKKNAYETQKSIEICNYISPDRSRGMVIEDEKNKILVRVLQKQTFKGMAVESCYTAINETQHSPPKTPPAPTPVTFDSIDPNGKATRVSWESVLDRILGIQLDRMENDGQTNMKNYGTPNANICLMRPNDRTIYATCSVKWINGEELLRMDSYYTLNMFRTPFLFSNLPTKNHSDMVKKQPPAPQPSKQETNSTTTPPVPRGPPVSQIPPNARWADQTAKSAAPKTTYLSAAQSLKAMQPAGAAAVSIHTSMQRGGMAALDIF